MPEATPRPTTESLLVTPATRAYILGTPRHTKLQAWLTANGIDPNDVSVDHDLKTVTTDGATVIDHHVFLRDDTGRRYLDTATGHAAAEHRTNPCTVPPPIAKRSDITTRALLQCVADQTAARQDVPFTESLKIPRAWDLLCQVYPEKVVAAALFRENDRDFLDYGVNVTYSFLTWEGELRLMFLSSRSST